MEYLIVDHCFPEFDVWTQFVSEYFAHSLKLDALRNRYYFQMSTGLSVTYPSPKSNVNSSFSLKGKCRTRGGVGGQVSIC